MPCLRVLAFDWGSGSTAWPLGPPGVSFVGRPFPLDEADEHFKRLRAWGLTFLRFLVTWEVIPKPELHMHAWAERVLDMETQSLQTMP